MGCRRERGAGHGLEDTREITNGEEDVTHQPDPMLASGFWAALASQDLRLFSHVIVPVGCKRHFGCLVDTRAPNNAGTNNGLTTYTGSINYSYGAFVSVRPSTS
jgi:hypothetical protein